jgi:GTPase SAR1 family protein
MNRTDSMALAFAVYDVSSKESFDALPRWFTELETYVSGSVVKILVGNKVDKVCTLVATAQLVTDRSCYSLLLGIFTAGANRDGCQICQIHELPVHRSLCQDSNRRERSLH